MKAISEKRLRHLADQCAKSTEPLRRCHCRCGGELHGQYHDDNWIAETLFRERLRSQVDPTQNDWVGFEEFAAYL